MKGQSKKLKRLQEQQDRLTQFDQEVDHYEEKDMGGEIWVKNYNGTTGRWQVSIFTPKSFRRYKNYTDNKNMTKQQIDWREDFIEKGADLEHSRWAKWQNYLHSFLTWYDEVKGWVLPHDKKEWWDSEIRTPYAMLTEKQKESDRKETREYLPLVEKILISHLSEVKEALNSTEIAERIVIEYANLSGRESENRAYVREAARKVIDQVSHLLSEKIKNI